ncbi:MULTISPECIES: tRNA (adenosine(37)-N6)-threonylcarbamoyltransferase complex dimerization subunit type 1 TsaB [unclassified Curtobacterium]|uniref:tRNA (adenosine(37)-N6)-threonylcarbamoyltransferase complex dimerization subunit type 1 TsaB n=1 Tax=unclassified Curtobacterium TaxID=257496 RepID=UPI000DA8FA30|nr:MULTISPECIES: tRNA (adenosine(37)-N6)-threonylcarbamoyltransferase complex dimerization subunit type 1 TsaB [unclassified Curtobacterium]PZE28096.1 tRNA (adenosine(37)-N6)-threonylcarbamoyltransferase complex dimerization subunit type 1 TsaB [Curtobacterium sp. MCBD17_028]PZE74036.1 tRNA (adenosine(37)-N6)-threonylcarbamoyltransferase complex dimerization subunit type 1 TsaB [Curtobacterium sp. MCBD17_019]PZF62292.1 tRNA (adenosine(37)-N6)-threonylcarbamoyltransferase complex dimerization sub
MLLTIDTSAGTAVALVDPAARTVLAERSTEDTRRHAEVVGPFLADVLSIAGVTPAAVTGVVAGMGPGPFTGLRVGIAAARTFAVARSVPFLPVVSHDAVAAAEADGGPLVVLTDARRREVYWSVYAGGSEAVATGRSDRHRASRPLPVRTAGPGLARPDDLDAVLGDAADLRRVTAVTIPAGRLGLLAAERLAVGAPFADDEPLYLRDPDVTMPGAPKRVRS